MQLLFDITKSLFWQIPASSSLTFQHIYWFLQQAMMASEAGAVGSSSPETSHSQRKKYKKDAYFSDEEELDDWCWVKSDTRNLWINSHRRLLHFQDGIPGTSRHSPSRLLYPWSSNGHGVMSHCLELMARTDKSRSGFVGNGRSGSLISFKINSLPFKLCLMCHKPTM